MIAHRKTTIWLGSDDSDEDGFNVHSEDNMVAIEAQLGNDVNGEDLEIFILRDLFPKIRAVMDLIDGRFPARESKDT
jgi:hypothetical protein